jgi:hypothetical protein
VSTPRSDRMITTYFRLLASLFSVASYTLMTSGLIIPGVIVNLFCQLLLVPFAIKSRAYDMVGLSALFGGINLHILIQAILA